MTKITYLCGIETTKLRKQDLVVLLMLAVNKIDYLENVKDCGDCDERDFKDITCDCNYIMQDLIIEMKELNEIEQGDAV